MLSALTASGDHAGKDPRPVWRPIGQSLGGSYLSEGVRQRGVRSADSDSLLPQSPPFLKGFNWSRGPTDLLWFCGLPVPGCPLTLVPAMSPSRGIPACITAWPGLLLDPRSSFWLSTLRGHVRKASFPVFLYINSIFLRRCASQVDDDDPHAVSGAPL